MTARLWTICHGAVSLELADYFGHEGHGLYRVLGPLAVDAIVGMGDERERTMRSLATAIGTDGRANGFVGRRSARIRATTRRPPARCPRRSALAARHRSSGRRPPRTRRQFAAGGVLLHARSHVDRIAERGEVDHRLTDVARMALPR